METHSDGGRCQVRIWERPGASPVVIITDPPDNTNTSVTNMVEYLSAEIARERVPHRFEYVDPFTVIPHHPAEPGSSLRELREERFALVEYENYRPRTQWLGGKQRLRIGQPQWKYLPREAVEELVGPL